jgi:transposase
MLYIHLTDEQRAELEQVSRQAVGRVALRAQMVLLSDRGHPVPQIAAIQGCGQDVVRGWLHRYRDHGVAGLHDLPRSGRPPKDRLAGQIVDAQASQSPRCAGLVQSCWTVALLTAFLAARFGLLLSTTTVRRHLRGAGWRWRRPRLAPASALPHKRDPDAAAKEAAIATALAEARRGRGRLLFLDECDLHLLPVLRACWQKGPRLRVPTPGTNAKRAFFGALDAASGACHTADYDRKLAVHFVAFLQRLADTYPAERLVLVMDNVRMHDAKVVRQWLAAHPRVTVLWLPKYAAHDANPVERLWGLMKDDVAANRLAGTLAELTLAARRFCATLPPHPVPTSYLAPAEPVPNLRRCA